MSFFLQHGYGKSNRLELMGAAGLLSGVILSPRDEDHSAAKASASIARSLGAEVLLDPQVYVWSIPDGSARFHESHGLEFGSLDWGLDPARITSHAKAAIDAQSAVDADLFLTPACLQRSFNDAWAALNVQFARAALNLVSPETLYMSVVVDESALSDWPRVEEWLDLVTTLDVAGFYLVTAQPPADYPRSWPPEILANLCRLIYRLAVLNEYGVVLGYSEVEGLLAVAAGARALASGWYYSLRRFNETKWQPSSGGRQPRPRVFLDQLLLPVLGTEFDALALRYASSDLTSDPGLHASLASGFGRPEASNQFLLSAARCSQHLCGIADQAARVRDLQETLEHARSVVRGAAQGGVALPTAYEARLESFLRALDGFARSEGL